jgi:hypothetical protein
MMTRISHTICGSPGNRNARPVVICAAAIWKQRLPADILLLNNARPDRVVFCSRHPPCSGTEVIFLEPE